MLYLTIIRTGKNCEIVLSRVSKTFENKTTGGGGDEIMQNGYYSCQTLNQQ